MPIKLEDILHVNKTALRMLGEKLKSKPKRSLPVDEESGIAKRTKPVDLA